MSEMKELRVDLLDPSPFETRERFEVLESVEELGILQPLLVRPKGKRFEVICGHRRLETLKKLGKELAPCEVKVLDDDQAAKALFMDNQDRRDFTDYERGLFFERYMKEFQIGQREAGRRLGISDTLVNLCLGVVAARKRVLVPTSSDGDAEIYQRAMTTNKFKEVNRLDEANKGPALQAIVGERLTTSETRSLVAMLHSGRSIEDAVTKTVNARETEKPRKFQASRAGTKCQVCEGATLIHNEDGSHEILESGAQ
jgi:ParB/RepB/Spo0J family partition protein